jgi:hypothetical protein
MPYCPICKIEYRAGFAKCCHCLASLVGSAQEADAAKLVLLCKDLERDKFEAIVAALQAAKIPSRAGCGEEADKGNPLARVAKMKDKKNASWQVSVLEEDFERARSVARSCHCPT